MGEIIGAGVLSHVPTLMLPEPVRREIYGDKDTTLIEGLQRLRSEVLDELRPDTIIVFDTHWGTLVEFVVTAQARRMGKYTSEELPRGMSQVPYDMKGNPELAHQIAIDATNAGARCTAIDDPYLPIHYPTVNLAHYLNRGEEWLSIGMTMSGESDDFLTVGRGIRKAVEQSNRRVVLLASGSMSHTFHRFQDVSNGKFETADPENIFSPAARNADYERLEWFKQGRHASVIDTMPVYLKYKPEGKFGHYLMMVAALGGHQCKAKGRLFSEYENSMGTSQVHVWFDRPASGWE